MFKKVALGLAVVAMITLGSFQYANAQGISLAQLVEFFIQAGIISADKAPAARAALSTPGTLPSTTPTPSTVAVPTAVLVSKNISLNTITPGSYVVSATFNISLTAAGRDFIFGQDSFNFGIYRNGVLFQGNPVSNTAFSIPSVGVVTIGYPSGQFNLPAGNTVQIPVTFTFENRTVSGEALAGGVYAVGLDYISYTESSGDKSSLNFMNGSLNWRTSAVTIAGPSTVTPPTTGFHSADTNQDWRVSDAELTAFTALYNYRNGTVRTGDYHTVGNLYVAGPGDRAGDTHSADTNRDWKFSLLELTRVIELKNASGGYRVQAGTEDGFAPINTAVTPATTISVPSLFSIPTSPVTQGTQTAQVAAPSLSSTSWYVDDSSTWPTVSTISTLSSTQTMRVRNIITGEQFLLQSNGVSTRRLTSSPAAGTVHLELYVYDSARGGSVASATVVATVTTRPTATTPTNPSLFQWTPQNTPQTPTIFGENPTGPVDLPQSVAECPTGKVCQWFTVGGNSSLAGMGVSIIYAEGTYGLYGDQATKDRFCVASQFSHNEGGRHESALWSGNYTTKIHVFWTGSSWGQRNANNPNYVTRIYCSKNDPNPVTPVVPVVPVTPVPPVTPVNPAPAVIVAPDLSSTSWNFFDQNTWPTLSTPTTLTANQSMRVKNLLTGEHHFVQANAINSRKITSSPAVGTVQLELYVYDYTLARIVATRTVSVTVAGNNPVAPAPAAIVAPTLSTTSWNATDPNTWPIVSTPSTLTPNQAVRVKGPNGNQYFEAARGTNSGRLTSTPPAGTTQVILYVYDYGTNTYAVAERAVSVNITNGSYSLVNQPPGGYTENPSAPPDQILSEPNATCSTGKVCQWFSVGDNAALGRMGVSILTNATYGLYNDQITKNRFCVASQYQTNEGGYADLGVWSSRLGKTHVVWTGSAWADRDVSNTLQYVTRVYCSKTDPNYNPTPTPAPTPAPVVQIALPSLSTVSWNASNPSTWPTVSTASTLTSNQAVRVKGPNGAQYFEVPRGTNSGRLTSTPPAGTTVLYLYVYDYGTNTYAVPERAVGVNITNGTASVQTQPTSTSIATPTLSTTSWYADDPSTWPTVSTSALNSNQGLRVKGPNGNQYFEVARGTSSGRLTSSPPAGTNQVILYVYDYALGGYATPERFIGVTITNKPAVAPANPPTSPANVSFTTSVLSTCVQRQAGITARLSVIGGDAESRSLEVDMEDDGSFTEVASWGPGSGMTSYHIPTYNFDGSGDNVLIRGVVNGTRSAPLTVLVRSDCPLNGPAQTVFNGNSTNMANAYVGVDTLLRFLDILKK